MEDNKTVEENTEKEGNDNHITEEITKDVTVENQPEEVED